MNNTNTYYWSEQEDGLLKELYIKKAPKSEVLKAFPNRSYGAIKHRAKILKIKKIRLQYKNDLFFETPNELNCSVAGMLASDGNIKKQGPKSGYIVNLGLSRKDRVIIEDIVKAVDSNAIISDYSRIKALKTNRNENAVEKEYFISCVCFSAAKKWTEDLQKWWGITPAKSLTITAPILNDSNLSFAYILGLINGDGSIGLQKAAGHEYVYIRLLGTRNLMEWVKCRFEEFLETTLKGSVHLERATANVYCFQVNGVQAIKLIEKMNSIPNTIKLARKWENPEIINVINIIKLKNPNLLYKDSGTKYNISDTLTQ